MEDMAETKWRKMYERKDEKEKRDNLLIPGPMGQDTPVDWRIKYQRETRYMQVYMAASQGLYPHLDKHCRYLRKPVSIRHTNIQKYCKYMLTYIQIHINIGLQ